MKKQLLIVSTLMMVLGLFLPNSYAVGTTTSPITTVDENGDTEKAALFTTTKKGKIGQFFKKKMAQAKGVAMMMKTSWKMMKAGDIDLKDDVEKWKWYWIFGWGAAVIFYILALVLGIGTAVSTGGSTGFGISRLFAWIGNLCGLAGTISLIMYLVKGDVI